MAYVLLSGAFAVNLDLPGTTQSALVAEALTNRNATTTILSVVLEVFMSFRGKNALVTGSSRGIGRGIALSLAGRGAQVAIHYYRNQAAAQATLGRVRELGSSGFLVQAAVCRPD